MNVCTNCNSNTTYVTKDGKIKWCTWKGSLVCQKCWNILNYHENPDKYKKSVQNWVSKNRKKNALDHKKWSQNNPRKRLQYNKKYLKKRELLGWALRLWSKLVKIKDKNTCQICGKHGKEIHHIIHKSKYPQLALNINNGIMLCLEHHYEAHGKTLKP